MAQTPEKSRPPAIGAIGINVVSSVAELAAARGLSLRQLSDRLGKIGRPILPSVLHALSQGRRRVDSDDLVALALALDVTPNSLLFPRHAQRDDEVELTPKVRKRVGEVWEWADGKWPLDSGRVSLATATLATGPPVDPLRAADFKRYARPDGAGDGTASETDPAITVVLDLAARIMIAQAPNVTERSEHIDYVIRGYRLLGLALEEMFAQMEQSGIVFDRLGAVRQLQSAIDEVRRDPSSDPSSERH